MLTKFGLQLGINPELLENSIICIRPEESVYDKTYWTSNYQNWMSSQLGKRFATQGEIQEEMRYVEEQVEKEEKYWD